MRIWRGGDLLRGANREELYHEMRVLRPIPARAVSAVDSLLLELDVICSLCMYIVVILTINEKFSKNLRSAYPWTERHRPRQSEWCILDSIEIIESRSKAQ